MIQPKSLSGQGDGRRHDRCPGQTAVALERVQQASDAAGHARCEVAEAIKRLVDVAGFVQEHGGCGCRGRPFPKVQGDRVPGVRAVNEHKAAAAQVAGSRENDRQSETHSDGRIDRVAALAKHGCTDLAGQSFLANHHAPGANGRMIGAVVTDDGLHRAMGGRGLRRSGREDQACGQQRWEDAGTGAESAVSHAVESASSRGALPSAVWTARPAAQHALRSRPPGSSRACHAPG